jgi:hypothetical protein
MSCLSKQKSSDHRINLTFPYVSFVSDRSVRLVGKPHQALRTQKTVFPADPGGFEPTVLSVAPSVRVQEIDWTQLLSSGNGVVSFCAIKKTFSLHVPAVI